MRIERKAGIELLVAVGASFLLYQIDMLYFLFTVPLHVIALRQHKEVFLTAIGGVLAAVVVEELIRFHSFEMAGNGMLIMAIGLYVPSALLIGAAVYHMIDASVRRLYRFVGSWFYCALAGFILIIIFEGDSSAAVFTRDLIKEQFTVFLSLGQEIDGTGVFGSIAPETLYMMAIYTVERSFLLGMIVQLGISILLSQLIQNKTSGRVDPWFQRFFVPELLLWPFLISWAIILVSSMIETGIVGIIGWNIGLGLGLLYFVQGVSILYWLLRRRGARLSLGTSIVLGLLILLLPGINVLMMLGIPLLGISEIWIRYRVVNKENSNENNS